MEQPIIVDLEGEGSQDDEIDIDNIGTFIDKITMYKKLQNELNNEKEKPNSKKVKVKLPTVISQNIKNKEELLIEVRKARAANNKALILSLLKNLLPKCRDLVKVSEEEFALHAREECEIELEMCMYSELVCDAIEALKLHPTDPHIRYCLAEGYLNTNQPLRAHWQYLITVSLLESRTLIEEPDILQYKTEELSYKLQLRKPQKNIKKEIFLQIGGNNSQGALGNPELLSVDLAPMEDLQGRKILEIACGDFHTIIKLGCFCLSLYDKCRGNECNIGEDIVGFGFNIHGQVDGNNGNIYTPNIYTPNIYTPHRILPKSMDNSIIDKPKIINYFLGRRIIKLAAKGSRSFALSAELEVYLWGYGVQGIQCVYNLNMNIVGVSLGRSFIFYLLDSGQCLLQGFIQYAQQNIFNFHSPVPINDFTHVDHNFIQISAGYNHALFLTQDGQVYSMGIGNMGQLGLGEEVQICEEPTQIMDLNDPKDKIVKVSCGGNFSMCMSDLGCLYIWGQISSQSDASSLDIFWYPSITTYATTELAHFCGLFHQIMGLDDGGNVLNCELQYQDMLRYHIPPISFPGAKRIFMGRSHYLLLKPMIDPLKCRVLDVNAEGWATIVENRFIIQIFDSLGPALIQNLDSVPISLIFLSKQLPDNGLPNTFDIREYITKSGKRLDDCEDVELQKWYFEEYPNINIMKFDINLDINIDDRSLIHVGVNTEMDGYFYMYVFIGNIIIHDIKIEIHKSPEHIKLEENLEEQKNKEDLQAKERQLEKERKLLEQQKKLEKREKMQEEKIKEKERRVKATTERSSNAMKLLKKKNLEEKKEMDLREARKELQTGGGFDLNKLAKKNRGDEKKK